MAMPIKVAARLAKGAPLDELYHYAEPRKSVRTTGLLRMLDKAAEKMRNYSVVVRACADETARLRAENARLREALQAVEDWDLQWADGLDENVSRIKAMVREALKKP